MKTNISKWLDLAVILMFCAATFQIADGRWIPGAVCFGGAAVLMCIIGLYGKKEKQSNASEGEREQADHHTV